MACYLDLIGFHCILRDLIGFKYIYISYLIGSNSFSWN